MANDFNEDKIPEDPEPKIDEKIDAKQALGLALVGLISKRFTLAEQILLGTMLFGFATIFWVPDSRMQIALTIFAYIAGWASSAVTFYLRDHTQAAQQVQAGQLEFGKLAQSPR